jgi:predicted RNA-binding Zn-ribbon protein involved in translation (DUF1610 family)
MMEYTAADGKIRNKVTVERNIYDKDYMKIFCPECGKFMQDFSGVKLTTGRIEFDCLHCGAISYYNAKDE